MKRLLVALIFLGFSAAIFADPEMDRFTAKVSVPDESAAAVQNALPDAFAQVLVNISGNSNIATQDAIEKIKAQLPNFLQNYTFVRENNAQGESNLLVQITFDKNAVEDFLQKTGQKEVATNEAATKTLQLTISGINNLQDYLAVKAAIKNLPGIKHIIVNDMSGSTLALSLEAQGGAQNISQAMSANPNFVPDSVQENNLSYRWVRKS